MALALARLVLDIAHVSPWPQASATELRDAVIDMTVAACAEAAVTAVVDGAPLRSLPMTLGTRDTKPLKLESRSTCMPPRALISSIDGPRSGRLRRGGGDGGHVRACSGQTRRG